MEEFRELSRIGNNINQIARSLNQGLEAPGLAPQGTAALAGAAQLPDAGEGRTMIVKIHRSGQSFRSAAEYCLGDKAPEREEGEERSGRSTRRAIRAGRGRS